MSIHREQQAASKQLCRNESSREEHSWSEAGYKLSRNGLSRVAGMSIQRSSRLQVKQQYRKQVWAFRGSSRLPVKQQRPK